MSEEILTPNIAESTNSTEQENVLQHSVILKNVDIYQKKIPILTKVNMEVKKGEFVYLIGRTGSGKSSILKLLFADIKARGEEAMCAELSLAIKRFAKRQMIWFRRDKEILWLDMLNNPQAQAEAYIRAFLDE